MMIGTAAELVDKTPDIAIDFRAPEHMRAAHRSLLYDLWDDAVLGGIAGPVARGLLERLSSHFSREEELIRSIYAFARPDSEGEGRPEPEDVAVMVGFIESELNDLQLEHAELESSIRELEELAEAVFDERLYDLAHRLAANMDEEERVHFPAAGLVGRTFIQASV